MGKMFTFEPQEGAHYRYDYEKVCFDLNKTYEDKDWAKACAIVRKYCLEDLFFLMYFVGGIDEVNHPFMVERINDFMDNPTKTLNLWFRLGYKSSIVTVYGTIQEALTRNVSAAIFSHTRDIAKSFLRRIKVILETNGLLRSAFYDKIPQNPLTTKGLTWDMDVYLQLKDGMKLGSTIAAYGLVDSLPTGIHPNLIVYDDISELKSVSTADQREKLETAFKHSFGLHDKHARFRIVGTRYHHADLYGKLIESGSYKVFCYPATHNGEFPYKPESATDNIPPMGDGISVYYSQEYLWEKFKEMGRDVFSTQMLMNPTKASERTFDIDWIKYYEESPQTRNYIFVDPASSAKKDSSYTVMWVVGVGSRGYFYIRDCVRDRLNLAERKDKLFGLVEKWNVRKVYYEKYSMQADIEYMQEKMREEGLYFTIIPVGGTHLSKDERILALQPLFMEGRILFPKSIAYVGNKGKKRNLVEEFIKDEYLDFPLCATKDMLDCLARIRDKDVKIFFTRGDEKTPTIDKPNPLKRTDYSSYNWMVQ